MNQTIELVIVSAFAIGLGSAILFSPYWLGSLFIILTDEAAKRNDNIPLEPKERRRWFVRLLWRGWWMYFVLASLIFLAKLWDLFHYLLGA